MAAEGERPKPEQRLVELARSSWDVLTRMAVAMERQAAASEKIVALLERRPAGGASSPSPAGAPGGSNGAGRQPDATLKIRFGKNKGQLVVDLETKQVRSAAHFIAETWWQSEQYRDLNLKQLEALNLHLDSRGSPRIDPEPEGTAAPRGPSSTYSSAPPPAEEPAPGGGPSDDDIPF